jgi:hypothetical protein
MTASEDSAVLPASERVPGPERAPGLASEPEPGPEEARTGSDPA